MDSKWTAHLCSCEIHWLHSPLQIPADHWSQQQHWYGSATAASLTRAGYGGPLLLIPMPLLLLLPGRTRPTWQKHRHESEPERMSAPAGARTRCRWRETRLAGDDQSGVPGEGGTGGDCGSWRHGGLTLMWEAGRSWCGRLGTWRCWAHPANPFRHLHILLHTMSTQLKKTTKKTKTTTTTTNKQLNNM